MMTLRLGIVGMVVAFAVPAANADGPSIRAATDVTDSAELVPVAVPEPSERAVRFHQSGHWVWAFWQVWSLAVPLVILTTGASARLRDVSRKVGRGKWFRTAALYLAFYLTLVFVVNLPLRYLLGFVRLHEYGLSNQTFSKWVVDSVKGHGVELLGAVTFAWVPFWLIARLPRVWWLVLAALGVPFIAFIALISPVFIDPLFNKFGPMSDKGLERKILALAQRAGIEGGRVYEVNKSVDTKAANAYVTGLLGTHRIVLWDTLLAKFDEREVLAVMGHEMGHYALGHVERSVLLSSVLLVAGLFWTDRAGRWALRRWGGRWKVESLADVAATPLILVVMATSALVLDPLAMAYSRHQEHEADRFALELTRFNHSAARAFVDLQRENLGVPRPDPFCTTFRMTHPSAAERIEFCNSYRPWAEGRPLRYAGKFSP